MHSQTDIILVSANAEWRVIKKLFPAEHYLASPFGEYFLSTQIQKSEAIELIFFHGGWGKIAAAASTQYLIDRWQPALIINLGTCGGFEGRIQRGEIVLAESTVVYDIIEQMGDSADHIAHYTTRLDLDWLPDPFPLEVNRTMLISGDRDLLAEDVPMLSREFGAAAGDWESGAIAWVSARNKVRLLILRGVTDLVAESGGEAYGNLSLYQEAAEQIMGRLVAGLPALLEAI